MLALMVGTDCLATAPTADFYLSPNGSDQWSGKLAEPNAQGTDGPFATLERAHDAVRLLKKQPVGRHPRFDPPGNLSTVQDRGLRSGRFRNR